LNSERSEFLNKYNLTLPLKFEPTKGLKCVVREMTYTLLFAMCPMTGTYRKWFTRAEIEEVEWRGK
jgi:hypothetical protein